MEAEWTGADDAGAISTTSASDIVAGYIRGLVFSGELGPDDKLPPSRELATRLGVSLVTLRLALKSLEATGYLVTSRGSRGGTSVSDAATLGACWTRWLQENADGVDDLFELRTTIETRVAWLAAKRRTKQDLADIEAANTILSETHSSVLRWNVAFHDAVARAAHSEELRRVMADVRERLFLPVDVALRERRIVVMRADHAAIAAAIRARDSAGAAEITRRHIEAVRVLMSRDSK
jgi:GntR family transcriptional repressor for pyruvate dehydrogenase complex